MKNGDVPEKPWELYILDIKLDSHEEEWGSVDPRFEVRRGLRLPREILPGETRRVSA
jgi:hypothetical protein